ncbi:hypothetical protein EVAR_98180_1 [Eumeta japonica]|uniref:Uncharacterized protein n=1 Tax=Eumeta variegata TaxID=151549 RepID=A0A4C1YHM6_EUMVA|nr:hypothetical protein EVAR_98180_1 [Eumeta japonica]
MYKDNTYGTRVSCATLTCPAAGSLPFSRTAKGKTRYNGYNLNVLGAVARTQSGAGVNGPRSAHNGAARRAPAYLFVRLRQPIALRVGEQETVASVAMTMVISSHQLVQTQRERRKTYDLQSEIKLQSVKGISRDASVYKCKLPQNSPQILLRFCFCIASIAGLERGDRIQKFRNENNQTPPTPTGTAVILFTFAIYR